MDGRPNRRNKAAFFKPLRGSVDVALNTLFDAPQFLTSKYLKYRPALNFVVLFTNGFFIKL